MQQAQIDRCEQRSRYRRVFYVVIQFPCSNLGICQLCWNAGILISSINLVIADETVRQGNRNKRYHEMAFVEPD